MRKVYVKKTTNTGLRKNAPFRIILSMTMDCCNKACLSSITKEDIRFQRQAVYSQAYEHQNYALANLIHTEILLSGRTRITYRIPGVGTVCKSAFKKCFALSNKKIQCLLKKRRGNAPTLLRDLRGRHKNNYRKLLPVTRDAVISFLRSFHPVVSHYRRSVTEKRYFSSVQTMRAMWKEFIRRNTNIKTTRLHRLNKGPPISYSCFRNIFKVHLSHEMSFRCARVDTCQTCDKLLNRQQNLEKEIVENGQPVRQKEQAIVQIKLELQNHLYEADVRYGALEYDILELANIKK